LAEATDRDRGGSAHPGDRAESDLGRPRVQPAARSLRDPGGDVPSRRARRDRTSRSRARGDAIRAPRSEPLVSPVAWLRAEHRSRRWIASRRCRRLIRLPSNLSHSNDATASSGDNFQRSYKFISMATKLIRWVEATVFSFLAARSALT